MAQGNTKTMLAETEVGLLHLTPWVEVVGTYHGSHVDGYHIYVRVGKRAVAFPDDSMEAALVRKTLNEKMVGRKIGILKSGLPGKPLLVRLISQ